jgi:hypothetical protein
MLHLTLSQYSRVLGVFVGILLVSGRVDASQIIPALLFFFSFPGNASYFFLFCATDGVSSDNLAMNFARAIPRAAGYIWQICAWNVSLDGACKRPSLVTRTVIRCPEDD